MKGLMFIAFKEHLQLQNVFFLKMLLRIKKSMGNIAQNYAVNGYILPLRNIYHLFIYIFFIYLSFLISTSSLFDKRGMEATKTHIKFPLMLCLSVRRKTCFDNIIIIKFETKNTHIGKKAFYIRLKEDEIMMIFSSPG